MTDWYRARVNATKVRTDAAKAAKVDAAACAKPEQCPFCKSPAGYLRPVGPVYYCEVCSHTVDIVQPKVHKE